jgi:decaprenyl-phosphate phosphoribosyltransferase
VVYITTQLSYCLWLKHQAVVDISIVASGFLLRAIAGGAAAGIALSQWVFAHYRVRVTVHGGR